MKKILYIILPLLLLSFSQRENEELQRIVDINNEVEGRVRSAKQKAKHLKELDSIQYSNLYFKILNEIKKHEGISTNVYYCAGGYPTIGYGHVVKGNENYSYLSKQQCHNLLIKDYNECISLVKQYTTIKNNKQILIHAHVVYALGIGTYLSMYKTNRPLETLLNYYSFYISPSGDKVYSSYINKIRQFEINLLKSIK